MPDIVLFGPPGSGKGTQAKRMKGYRHISTGDLFRNAVANRSVLGRKIEGILGNGKLIPDQITLDLVEENCHGGDIAWDGFPRTIVQAEALDRMMAKSHRRISYVINLMVPDDVLLERIMSRFKTSGRSDDNPETFAIRLATYQALTKPVLDYYSGRVVSIDGTEKADDIAAKIARLA